MADLLAQHPEVYFCPEKEPRFFSHDGNYERGFEAYEDLFSGAKGQKRVGEGSTTYSHAWLNRRERSARRIGEYRPDAKILYCVRHPLRRIESAWIMVMWALDNGHIQGTELHRSGKLNISGDFNDDVRNNDGLIVTTNYWQTLQCYRNEFSGDQIKIVFLELLKAHPERTLAECCQFLDIAPDVSFDDPDEARNTSASKGLATTFGRIVRSVPGYQALAAGAPSFLKTLVRPLIKDSFTEKPDWEPAVKEEVVSRLRKDTNRFLNYVGRSDDHWILDE